MAFSLSNWFKGKPEDDPDAPASPDADAPVIAPPQSNRVPASVRTVTPNSVHAQAQNPVSLRDPSAPRVPISLPTAKPPSTGKVPSPMPQTRRVAAKMIGAPAEMRPAVPAYEPAFTPTAPDVKISLEIGDFLDRLPPNFLKPEPPDRHQKVEFQASELYSDLAKGRASVPASVIFRRCPELFARPVSDTEDVEVQLPLQKLVEQMGTALSTREDQYLEENVGEIETPFLQVAMEDNARLPAANGSAVGAVRPPAGLSAQSAFRPAAPLAEEASDEIAIARPNRPGHVSAISPVKMPAEAAPLAPPTAASIGPISNGKRPPSTVRASVAGSKIRVSGQSSPPRIAAVPGEDAAASPSDDAALSTHSQRIGLPMQPTSPSHQVAKKTARIQIPPISLRTSGPNAAPRAGAVPAPPKAPVPPPPGMPSVPGPRANGDKDTVAAVTFRTSPPPSVKPVPLSFPPPKPPIFPPPAFPAASAPAPAPASAPDPVPVLARTDDRNIELGLAAILRGLPSSALTVEPSAVPDDVRVTLPFGLIERQLSQGRVSIARDIFVSALPEAHRGVLSDDDSSADIAIPLQEVFQNLPANALSLRADQVKEETGIHYPTPFSQKAEEDAQRFSPAASVPAPVSDVPAVEIPAPESAAAETPTDAPLDVAPPAPASDVELPSDTVPERDRDIPLDLEPAPAAEPPPVAPVEASQDTPMPVVPIVEKPVEEKPVMELPVLEAAPPAPEAPAAELPAAVPEAIAPPAVAKEKPAPAVVPAPVQDGVLQTLFMVEEELDAKMVVKLVCQFPSVTGCAIMFEDGLRLAGNFPEGDAQGFSAMSAPFFKRAARFVSELELGSLQTFTLHTEHGLLSFFMQDKICVSVRHTGRGFLPGIREKLEIVTRELARMYSNAAPGHAVQ